MDDGASSSGVIETVARIRDDHALPEGVDDALVVLCRRLTRNTLILSSGKRRLVLLRNERSGCSFQGLQEVARRTAVSMESGLVGGDDAA